MINMTLREIAIATKGLMDCKFNDISIENISTDSRKDLSKSLFIPLVGENFDGHNFINIAFEKGAVCVLSEKQIKTENPNIVVKNTRQALMDIASHYRDKFNIPVVAITGSTGKTTTKDIIACVLSQKYKTLKTEGNFNNEIGLPLTIFNLDNSHEALVVEMGMNNFGEIHNLSKIAKPDICIIINIGVSHIENLGSKEGILKAKCEILDFMNSNGHIILNGDDELLLGLKNFKENIIYYGTSSNNFIHVKDVKYNGLFHSQAKFHFGDNNIDVDIPVPGAHIVQNAMAAVGAGYVLNLTNEQIKSGIESFKLTQMRMEMFKTKNNITVINDAYNASPISMKAALDVLKTVEGNKICILGDMYELGEYTASMHYEVGEYAASIGIDLIICVGKLSRDIFNGAVSNKGNVVYFRNQEDFWIEISNLIIGFSTILVKASRGMHFEKTIEKLRTQLNEV